jgi:hypothetical protein
MAVLSPLVGGPPLVVFLELSQTTANTPARHQGGPCNEGGLHHTRSLTLSYGADSGRFMLVASQDADAVEVWGIPISSHLFSPNLITSSPHHTRIIPTSPRYRISSPHHRSPPGLPPRPGHGRARPHRPAARRLRRRRRRRVVHWITDPHVPP